MTTKELFDFITDMTINEENIEEYLEKAQEKITTREISAGEEIADAVFQNVFIPRTLDEVVKYEEDYEKTKSGGGGEDILYHTITGMKSDMSGPRSQPQLLQGIKEKVAPHI